MKKDKNSKHLRINDDHSPNINRRDFLIRTFQIGAGGTLALSLGTLMSGQTQAQTGSCDVNYVQTGYSATVSSAWIPKGQQSGHYATFKSMIGYATDFSWLKSGDSVLLKLALNSANPFPATTDPWILGCMIDLLKEKGAGTILVGDQSGIYQSNSTRTCLTNTGLMNVINAKGATAVCFDESSAGGFVRATPPGWSSSASYTKVVDNVAHIIYLPRIATHSLADRTFSLKIAVGFLNTSSRRTMHRGTLKKLYPGINDIPAIKNKFRLSVTSAMKLMTSGGPDSGTVVEPDQGLIFASGNLLAADLMAAAFLDVIQGSSTDIYCHDSVQSYISRNGNLETLVWKSINEHPNTSVTNGIIARLKKTGSSSSSSSSSTSTSSSSTSTSSSSTSSSSTSGWWTSSSSTSSSTTSSSSTSGWWTF